MKHNRNIQRGKYAKNGSWRNGFTLLEMIVALGIFMIVAVVAVGALVRITGLNRQAQTLQNSMNNLTFGLESMSREMRVGSSFDCIPNAPSVWSFPSSIGASGCPMNRIDTLSPTIIVFASSNVDPNTPTCHLLYAYRLVQLSTPGSPWSLQKAQQASCGSSQATFYPVMDDMNMTLQNFQIAVYPRSTSPDLGYAWAFVRLKGYAGLRVLDQNQFDVQTSISERLSD